MRPMSVRDYGAGGCSAAYCSARCTHGAVIVDPVRAGRPRGRVLNAFGMIVQPRGDHVAAGFDPSGRLPDVFTNAGYVLVHGVPERGGARAAARPPAAAAGHRRRPGAARAPRSSPIAAAGGVVMAGDRRATMGNLIASRDIEKVYPADAYSLVGIAGTAGIGIELMRLFQVELEHYEKIEGAMLSLDGKANRLATMIRGNLGAAHAGPRRGAAVRRLRPRRRPTRPRPAASSASTSPAAATRRPATTRSAPARCSPSRR